MQLGEIMLEGKTIAVVVPAYQEEQQIPKVLKSMPGFVDWIVVVDDASTDHTPEVVERFASRDPRVVLLRHERNKGVGAAIATGYRWARDKGVDVTAVMAGDFQMDPEDLPKVVLPVVRGWADYVKGNRLITGEAFRRIPWVRLMGNSVLSLLTKIASGYWNVADSQCGYTAIGLKVLRRLPLEEIYPRYGVPNDLLVKLNIAGARVMDLPVKPVYNVGERSKMNLLKVVFTISLLLMRLFFTRLVRKYVINDFHPLVFFYLLSMILVPVGLGIGIAIIVYNTSLFGPPMPLETGWLILCALCLITGMQSAFFAMFFDMEANRHLYVFHINYEELL